MIYDLSNSIQDHYLCKKYGERIFQYFRNSELPTCKLLKNLELSSDGELITSSLLN